MNDKTDITKNLIDFANALFEIADWPDGGDIDLGDFQDEAVKYGLLEPETRFEPCCEYCNCEGYYSEDEWAQGITCYRKALWLNDGVDPRNLTPRADGTTVAGSETSEQLAEDRQ